MPLVAYQGPHGSNDYPLHFAFFEAMERRGILNHVDFALDPYHDLEYCKLLVQRFPQLLLTIEASAVCKMAWFADRFIGRGAGPLSRIGGPKFDAVCEGPGGRIHPLYLKGDLFWRHPRISNRAVLFHSVEEGILSDHLACASLASCKLVVARSSGAAKVAAMAGTLRSGICTSSDIVLGQEISEAEYRPGYAVALRVPNEGPSTEYAERLRAILDFFDGVPAVDHVLMEAPFDEEQRQRGYGELQSAALFHGDEMYRPFQYRRDAIVSCRLHTTLIALLNGNRKVLQYQVEGHTRKLEQIFHDIGLESLQVRRVERLSAGDIRGFLSEGSVLEDTLVEQALQRARKLVESGLDRTCEWLDSL